MAQTTGVEHRARPLGQVVVGRVLRGHVERDTGGEHLRAEGGDVFLVALPDRPAIVHSVDVEVQLVRIDHAVLTDLAAEREGPVLFTGGHPVSAAAARHCAGLLEFLGRDVLGNDDAIASPLVVDQAARMLGAALLTTFANTASPTQDRAAPAPAALRRALAFVEQHAHEPVALTEIAAAAHVTPRMLQLTFRQELGTTPTEYLRRIRLDRAHFDLVAAEPADGTSVATVAQRWGFLHAGRFAARYRQVHGRSPRETLYSVRRR